MLSYGITHVRTITSLFQRIQTSGIGVLFKALRKFVIILKENVIKLPRTHRRNANFPAGIALK